MIGSAAFITAFLLGMAASFQPCLFPILPTFVAHLTGENSKKINGIVASLLVTLGIMIVFTTLTLLSQNILLYFANNYLLFRTIQGVLLIILAVLLIIGTTVHFTVLDRMSSAAGDLVDRIENPYLVSLVIGLLFTLLAAPCAIIIFGTAFTLIANATIIESILVMLVFSVGAGVPFFIIGGVVPSMKESIIQNRQKIQRIITVTSGVLIFFVGVYLTMDGTRTLPTWLIF